MNSIQQKFKENTKKDLYVPFEHKKKIKQIEYSLKNYSNTNPEFFSNQKIKFQENDNRLEGIKITPLDIQYESRSINDSPKTKQEKGVSSVRKKQQYLSKKQINELRYCYQQLKNKFNKREIIFKNLQKINIETIAECKYLEDVITKQKTIYNQTILKKNSQIENLKQIIEKKQKQILNIKQQLTSYQEFSKNQLTYLENQVKAQKNDNHKLRQEIKDILSPPSKKDSFGMQKLIKQKESLSQQQNFLLQKVSQLQQKIIHYISTFENNSVLRQKNAKIQKLQKQVRKIKLLSNKQIEQLKNHLQKTEKHIEQERARIKKQFKINSELVFLKKIQSKINLINDLKQKNNSLKHELERKNVYINQKQYEVKILNAKIKKYQAIFKSRNIQDYVKQNQMLSKSNTCQDLQYFRSRVTNFDQINNVTILKSLYFQLQRKYRDLEQEFKQKQDNKNRQIYQATKKLKLSNSKINNNQQNKSEFQQIELINSLNFRQQKQQLRTINQNLDEEIKIFKQLRESLIKNNQQLQQQNYSQLQIPESQIHNQQ